MVRATAGSFQGGLHLLAGALLLLEPLVAGLWGGVSVCVWKATNLGTGALGQGSYSHSWSWFLVLMFREHLESAVEDSFSRVLKPPTEWPPWWACPSPGCQDRLSFSPQLL